MNTVDTELNENQLEIIQFQTHQGFVNQNLEKQIEKNELSNKSTQHYNISLDFLNKQSIVPLTIAWKDLTITATIKDDKAKREHFWNKYPTYEKTILDNLEGHFKEGTLTSILGPSGSGKTTLLNFLSNKLNAKNLHIQGNININGNSVTSLSQFQTTFGFVEQDDILFTFFTPYESLKFAAQLRSTLPEQDQEEAIQQILAQFNLYECKDTVVGTKYNTKISKSERKRLSIGIELLANPSLLFLDEPTTGLDSVTAYEILLIIRNIAKQKRTVITTLHQPSSNLFKEFDQLLLLVDGKIIYQGDASGKNGSIEYFKNLDYKCKSHDNPADFYMNLMSPEGQMIDLLKQKLKEDTKADIDKDAIQREYQNRISNLRKYYYASEQFKAINQNELHYESTNLKDLQRSKKDNAFFRELFLVMKRNFKGLKAYMLISFIYIIFVAVQTIVLFRDLGEGRQGIIARTGFVMVLTMSLSFVGTMDVTLQIFDEVVLYIKETQNCTYRPSSYFVSKQIGMLFYEAFLVIMIGILTWIGVDLPWEKFGLTFIILWLIYEVAASVGYLMAAWIEKFDTLVTIFPLVLIPQLIVSGALINTNDIRWYMKWLEYISKTKYGYGAFIQHLFNITDKEEYYDPVNCANYPDGYCRPLEELDFPQTKTQCIIALICLIIIYRTIALILLKKRSLPIKLQIAQHSKKDNSEKVQQKYIENQ